MSDTGIVGMVVSDVAGGLHMANEAWFRLTGYSREELASGVLDWRRMTPPEYTARSWAAVEQVQAGGFAPPWEQEIIRKDGSRLEVLLAVANLDSFRCVCFMVDQSGRKQAEAALDERTRLAGLSSDVSLFMAQEGSLPELLRRCAGALREHLGCTGVRIWGADPSSGGLVLQATSGAASMETTRSEPAQALVSRINQGGDRCHVARLLQVGDELVGALELESATPLSAAANDGLRAVVDSLAVGVRRKMVESAKLDLEAQLRQAQKLEAIGALAGGIAHDFNNLLSVVVSYAELLGRSVDPADPMAEDLAEIRAAGERAAKLTHQLLAFSRRQVLQPRVVDLNEVMLTTEAMLRRVLGEDIALTVTPLEEPALVNVDPGQFEQVIMNLVVNARDAMPRGGRLRLELARKSSDVVLLVADTGQGMDTATLARIFEPFFTTKPAGKGTGLGLSTVFGIVRQSGGRVDVESALGKGTTFRVALPMAHEEAAAPSAPVARPPGALVGSETILLVEDDARVRKLTRVILRGAGYQVLEAETGGDALLICEQHETPIDLMLTDVVMPRMSGGELAHRLRHLRPDMRVVFMSGYPDASILQHGALPPDTAFVAKPITPGALLGKLRQVLEGRPS